MPSEEMKPVRTSGDRQTSSSCDPGTAQHLQRQPPRFRFWPLSHPRLCSASTSGLGGSTPPQPPTQSPPEDLRILMGDLRREEGPGRERLMLPQSGSTEQYLTVLLLWCVCGCVWGGGGSWLLLLDTKP